MPGGALLGVSEPVPGHWCLTEEARSPERLHPAKGPRPGRGTGRTRGVVDGLPTDGETTGPQLPQSGPRRGPGQHAEDSSVGSTGPRLNCCGS